MGQAPFRMIFNDAINNSSDYHSAIREKLSRTRSGEALFFELAPEDITRAAALFRPVSERTDIVDRWMSSEVSRCWHTAQPAVWPRPRICQQSKRRSARDRNGDS
jgi:hypothetical protein